MSGSRPFFECGDRMKRKKISIATISRLPIYLRCLSDLARKGTNVISSYELAEMAGTNAAQLRKDLSYFGEFGTRGVGYEVSSLSYQITKYLGLTEKRKLIIVGTGKLGSALFRYRGFAEKNFEVVGVFDKDPKKIGRKKDGLVIKDVEMLEDEVKKLGCVDIGIITTPASAAQKVADRLVAAGVKAILNFAPITLSVPSDVSLRQVDLAVELQILSFYRAFSAKGETK